MPRPATEDVATLIAVYVLHGRPEAGAAREHALQHLIEVTIYEHDGQLEASELVASIRELAGLGGDPPVEQVRDAVDGCRKRGCLEERGNRYILAQHRREAIEQARKTYASDEAHFDVCLQEAVANAIGKPVPLLAQAMLVSGVKGVIAEVLRDTVVEAQTVLDQKRPLSEMLSADSEHDPLPKLQGLAQTLAGHELEDRDAIVVGIRQFLGNLDGECQRYLAALHHKALVRQILNFDPHLHEVQKAELRQTRLYLDTNMVIDYILEEEEDHDTTAEVLEASQQLAMQLFVSPATLAELERQIEAGDTNKRLLDYPDLVAIATAGRRGVGSCPFLNAYLVRRSQQAGLTWEGFSSPYRDMEEYLLGKGVVVEAEAFEGLDSDQRYLDIQTRLRDVKSPWVSDHVVAHDAQNFLLIHRLREKHGPTLILGPSVWLLTRDSSLKALDRSVAREFATPHSCQRDAWARLLLPFENIVGFTFSDYIAHLLQSRLGVEPEGDSLDVEFLDSVRRPEFDMQELRGLPPEVAHKALVRLQCDRVSRQLVQKLRDSPDPEEKAAAGRQLTLMASAAASAVANDELTNRDRQISILQQQNQQLQDILRGITNRSLLQRIKDIFSPRRIPR
jgi:hypothetical protein